MKSGYKWRDVKGNTVRNIGETDMVGESHDGIPVDFVAQVSDETKKLLMSVRKAAEKGNMVIFGADINAIKKLAKLDKVEENMIVNHKTGVRSTIEDEQGMCAYPMTIRRKKNRDAMDLGTLESVNEKDDEWTPF